MLLLLLRQQQRLPSPRLRLPGLCFPKLLASRACVPRASQVVSQQVALQPLVSSGAPACPPSPRRTPTTAPRATPVGQPPVSFLFSTFPFLGNVRKIDHTSGAIIITTQFIRKPPS